jgi:uncharacterized protein with HEPN domain
MLKRCGKCHLPSFSSSKINTKMNTMRCFEIIGEATKKIPKNIKNGYTNIPWQEMSGIRDKLIHEYFGANLEVVWKTILEDLPELKQTIEKIVDDMNQNKS